MGSLDVMLLALLELLLLAGSVGWLADGLLRTALRYARGGTLRPDEGRQLMLRGTVALAIYVIVSALPRQLI